MSDPLALFPLAIAAGGGRLDGQESTALVAAGMTLLQRSATLVRALSGRRSAILLPNGAAFLVALAASDGRGALVLDPSGNAEQWAGLLERANVGAVFTIAELSPRLPPHVVVVLLDHAPSTARVLSDGLSRDVDLGSHFGLAIEGDREVEGLDEEALLSVRDAVNSANAFTVWTHRALIADMRAEVTAKQLTPMHITTSLMSWSDVGALLATCAAPLSIGGHVLTRPADR